MYLPYLLHGAGLGSMYVALFTGFQSIVELDSRQLCARLRDSDRIKLWQLLVFSGVFFALEHVLYTAASGYLMLFLIMIPSGFASGIQFGIAPNYIFEIVDESVCHSSQTTVNYVCFSVVGILETLGEGGVIYKYGIYTLTNINLVITVLASIIFVAFNLLSQKLAKGMEQRVKVIRAVMDTT